MFFEDALELCRSGNAIYREEEPDKKYVYIGGDLCLKVEGGYDELTSLAQSQFICSNVDMKKDVWKVDFKESNITGKTYIIDKRQFKTIQYVENNLDKILEYFGIDYKDISRSIRCWDELFPEKLSFVTPTKDVLIFQDTDYIVKACNTGTYFVLTKKQFNEIFVFYVEEDQNND